jgi:DnaJ-class molecular chaperone
MIRKIKPAVAYKIKEGSRRDCPRCKATGRIRSGGLLGRRLTCPDCYGHGVVYEVEVWTEEVADA